MHQRQRPPRLSILFPRYDFPLYFVTICTKNRAALLATDRVHSAFVGFAQRGFAEKQIAVGGYVLMPDHLHLFVRGAQDFVLAQWGRMLKHALGRVVRAKMDANSCSGASMKRPAGGEASPEGVCGKALHRSATTTSASAKTSRSLRGSSEIWERGFFDHLLRSSESYAQKWEYVRQNPVRAGLVQEASDWPYHGEIVAIPFD